MRLGFSFNGIHSNRFGITMLTKSRTLLPEAKQYSYSALSADGNYDFTEANRRGRAAYSNRTFQVVMQVGAENLLRLNEKINMICSWLIGRGELIFDDIPDSVWSARVINSVDFAPDCGGCKAIMNVVFDAEPFAKAEFDTLSGPLLDNSVRLESELELELDVGFEFVMKKGKTSCEIEVLNIGTWYVSPVLYFETKASKTFGISVECGASAITISDGIGDKTIIDADRCTIFDGLGNCLDRYTDGEFFELAPGKNTLKFSCEKKLKEDMKISVLYTPCYLYTANFTKCSEGYDA